MSHVNIQITEGLFHNSLSFPDDSTLEVEVRDGKKEGKAAVLSQAGISLAELNFQNDKLQGLCLYYNSYGDLVKEVNYEKGVQEGWYCLYDDSIISEMGIYKNGIQFSKLRSCKQDASFLEEVKGNKVISICKYNDNHKRDGLCTFYKNCMVSSVIRYENGIEKEKKCEFKGGKLIEFENKQVVYRGEYRGDAVNGFSRSGYGKCYQYEKENINRVDFVKNGSISGYQLIGAKLKEFNELGKLVYEGEYTGSAEDSYVWNGLGVEYKSDSEYVNGIFDKGRRVKTIKEINGKKMTEYDDENRIIYIGEFSSSDLERSGKGCCFLYDGMRIIEVNECLNGEVKRRMCEFDKNGMIEYNENGEVIYKGGFEGDVRSGYVRDGEGQEFEKDVLLYFGFWRNGEKEGIGRSYKDRKVRYKGNWKNGRPHGNGELLNGNKVVYKGEWMNGLFKVEKGSWFDFESEKMCGLYSNGLKKYEGEMMNGLPEGNGKYFDKDGKVLYEGKWKNGCFELRKGIGFDYESERECGLYKDGLKKYEGEMRDGLPDGRGTFFGKDGRILHKGYWIDGELHLKGCEWFCYKSEDIEIKRMKTIVEKSREVMKEIMKWMKTKKGMVITLSICIILVIILLLSIGLRFTSICGINYPIWFGTLTISGNNEFSGDIEISGSKNIRVIIVKKNSMKMVNSLKIYDCDRLKMIKTKSGEGSYRRNDSRNTGAFYYVRSVIISSFI